MQLPDSLVLALERVLADVHPNQVRQAANDLSAQYRKEEKQPTGVRILRDEAQMRAYLGFRMPATCAALLRAMEISCSCGAHPPRSLTDVGSGSGSAIWAAQCFAQDVLSVTAIEREEGMIALSGQLLSASTDALDVNFVQADMRTVPIPSADWVTASYCLGELSPDDGCSMVQRLWDATGHMLLIVEPGTPAGHARIQVYRTLLLNQGANIAAPCPQGACPINPPDWCHFAARVQRTRLHRLLKEGELNYEDEKFIFLAVLRTSATPCTARIRRRVVRHSGFSEISICTGGQAQTLRISKKQACYKRARKAELGDAWEEIE